MKFRTIMAASTAWNKKFRWRESQTRKCKYFFSVFGCCCCCFFCGTDGKGKSIIVIIIIYVNYCHYNYIWFGSWWNFGMTHFALSPMTVFCTEKYYTFTANCQLLPEPWNTQIIQLFRHCPHTTWRQFQSSFSFWSVIRGHGIWLRDTPIHSIQFLSLYTSFINLKAPV